MAAVLCFIVAVGCLAGSQACDTMSTVEVARQRPKFAPDYSQLADFWLGELEFVDFFCGWPYEISDRQRREVEDGYIEAERLMPAEINTLKLDHSMVYFRGHAFEWGASMMVDFNNGTIGRISRECDTCVWSRQGNSACTLEQAQRLAAQFFHNFGPYNLLTNNCHNFADWFMNNLSEGNCKF